MFLDSPNSGQHCRDVWPQSKLFLCLWHVRRAWQKNACAKLKDMETRAAALGIVGDLMYMSDTPNDYDDFRTIGGYRRAWTLLEWVFHVYSTSKARLPTADAYWKYFDKEWIPKMQMWVVGDRKIPHAGQETTAAIESFHSNLKAVLRQSKKKLVGRRMDWLVYELTGNVIEKYDYNDWSKENGFVKNKKIRQMVVNSIIQAKSIPDNNVALPPFDGAPALVKSSKRGHIVYAVHNPCTEWAVCECVYSQKGNICKHQVKVLELTRPDLAEGKIARYLGSLRGTAQGGMNNLLSTSRNQPGRVEDFPITALGEDNTFSSETPYRGIGSGLPAPRELGSTGHDDFDRMHQVILKLLEKAYRHPLLARHLDSALSSIDATLSRLEAEIECGMLHPLQQVADPLPANRDGLGMRLRRLQDFLDSRGYRVHGRRASDNLTQ